MNEKIKQIIKAVEKVYPQADIIINIDHTSTYVFSMREYGLKWHLWISDYENDVDLHLPFKSLDHMFAFAINLGREDISLSRGVLN